MSEDKPIKTIIDLLYLPSEGKLIPESDKTGNIEYKLRLDRKELKKCENMVSQMLFRMNEGRNQYGRYEANYILGVHDDGSFSDITEHVLSNSINVLKGVVKKANSKIVSEKIYVFPGNKMMAHILIRIDYKERALPESNVMILGPSGVGKSSLMGRLTHGQKDDGHGFTRKLVLRHPHEKTSGNTSCLKYDTIGFSGSSIINYAMGIDVNMEYIYNISDRLINLIDIPGDFESYSKTIMYSISSIHPDKIIICIPCNDTKEYLEEHTEFYKFITSVCTIYDIEPLIVMTKYDLTEDKESIYKHIIDDIQPLFIMARFDFGDKTKIKDGDISPKIIEVSNITDHGYDELIEELSNIECSEPKCIYENKMFIVNDVFSIPDTGIIYHGILKYGVLNVDDMVDILCHGVIMKHKIKSIHRKTLDVERLLTGESGSISLYGKYDKIDKTAIIIDPIWEKELVVKTFCKPISDIILKPQQYMFFNGNNILTILLSVINDKENIYEITSCNDIKFIIIEKIGILKDEKNNYFFVELYKSYPSYSSYSSAPPPQSPTALSSASSAAL
jgi:GTPase